MPAAWTLSSAGSAPKLKRRSEAQKPFEPVRSLGIASSIVPTRVSHSRPRYPFRCATRSSESAPAAVDTSASITSRSITRTASRNTSACSSTSSLLTAARTVMLSSLAVVVLPSSALR